MLHKRVHLYIFIFLVSIITQSCSHLNEFGQRRVNFNFERIKPNKDNQAYEIIDTTKLYKLIAIENRLQDENMKLEFKKNVDSNPKYLKFYANGRVGEFRNINLNNVESYNPKKAESNLYQFKNKKFIIQSYFVNAQCGQCFVKQILRKNPNGEIEVLSGDFTYTYNPINISKDFLIYKPDW
ncbi:hypothetical protein [Flavobacterium aquatile]|uniref:hypothetical protein n=1 Tax=Flavobacterium aquatile TaxID=245 RepID=UPI000AD665A6|nr:hypothetical protein [Flavobacterium aquatile]